MKLPVKGLFFTFFFLFSGTALASDFCDGFHSGYVAGYQEKNKTTLRPLLPMCPIQPIKGFGDPKSDFQHGYNIGYKKGLFGH